MVRAGELRHRVTLQQEDRSADDSGGLPVGSSRSPSDLKTVWGKVEEAGGSEGEVAAARASERDAVVTIRQDSQVDESMFVKYDGKRHEILNIQRDPTLRRTMKLEVKRVVGTT